MAFGTGTLPSLTGTTCPTGASIMHRLYDFHLGTGDNGNVQVINNCKDSNRTQNFFYDNFNRITQAYTTGSNWGETFTTDAWGNLTNKGPVSGKTLTETLNAAPATIKNQLNGFCHDAAGNLVLNAVCPTGTFTPTYSYDIENRLTSTNGWSYIYDGDGERVKKCNSCSTSAGGTLYWPSSVADTVLETDLAGTRKYEYMFFNGERIARRDGTNPPFYYFSDHLKSTDVVTNNTGAIQDESDYFPYGGEIVLSNLAPQNYKFNGKERDSESGLDEFGARYHSSGLSRFMTPDWAAKPTDVPYANFGNPQSLNLFSFVQNNPTTLGDPDGHCPICIIPVAVAAAVEVAESPEGQEVISEGEEAATELIETYGPQIEQGASNGWNFIKGAIAAGAAYFSSGNGDSAKGHSVHATNSEQSTEKEAEPKTETASGGNMKKGGGEHTKGARRSTKDKHEGTRSGQKKPPGYKSDRDFQKSREQKQREAQRRQAEKDRKKAWKKTKETKHH
jgi:RHS repeat-associated protein